MINKYVRIFDVIGLAACELPVHFATCTEVWVVTRIDVPLTISDVVIFQTLDAVCEMRNKRTKCHSVMSFALWSSLLVLY